MVRAQQTHHCPTSVLKTWKNLKSKLIALRELSPDLFETDANLSLVKISAAYVPPGGQDRDEHWGIGEPKISGDAFVAANENPEDKSVDVSPLVDGTKKGTFVVHRNFLDPDGNFYTPLFLHQNAKQGVAATRLFKLNKERIALRKWMETIAVKNKAPTTVEIQKHDGDRLVFEVGKENDMFLAYYHHFRDYIAELGSKKGA